MKKENLVSVPFMVLGIVFCVCLVAANLLETKVVQLGPISVTAGLIVFPISYIINDCIAEVWGFRKARLIIWMGFLMNFMVVAMGQLAVALPAAPFWEGEESFNFVFGMAPRIAVASLTAFLVGSFINAYVMSRMKVASQVVLKTLYEVIVLPVTVRVVKYIKRVDDTDVYDEHISYNILRIKEI